MTRRSGIDPHSHEVSGVAADKEDGRREEDFVTIELTPELGELSAGVLPHAHHTMARTLPAGALGTPHGRHLVALDIDGTTVQHDGTLRSPVRYAVRETVENGHDVVIATGRSMLAAKPVIDALGLRRGYAVFSNGAVTVRLDPSVRGGMEIIDQQTFAPRQVLDTLRGYFPTGALAVERVGVGFDVNRPFPPGELDGDVRAVSWRRLTRRPTTRVTFCDPDTDVEAFADHVGAMGLHGVNYAVGFDVNRPFPPGELDGDVRAVSWRRLTRRPTTRVTFCDPDTDVEAFADHVGAMGLHGVNYAVGFTAWLDITALGVSKASALEAVRGLVDAPIERTVAVGDQRNDLEMLAWAGCGVAMGNAPAEVAAVADYVTGHVDEDGLADVLRGLPML